MSNYISKWVVNRHLLNCYIIALLHTMALCNKLKTLNMIRSQKRVAEGQGLVKRSLFVLFACCLTRVSFICHTHTKGT